MHRIKNKSGQVTIFIIIAVIIIAIIILFFMLRKQNQPNTGGNPQENPGSFLDTCLKDRLTEAVDTISSQGGYVDPKFYKRFKFENETSYNNLAYLCYTQNYYVPCINQEPMLLSHLKLELHDYLKTDVENCFKFLGQNLENKGYVVEAKYNNFNVVLDERGVIINISGEIDLTKKNGGGNSIETNFKAMLPSKFYNLAKVAQEIVSQEAQFCNFNNLGYMLFYPEWKINKFKTGDSVTIYTIENRDSKEKFRFAVRGCVIPPGF
jgi:hypothetical protein